MKDSFFDNSSVLQMLDNDALQQLGRHSAVPYSFGINDDDRPPGAHAEARCLTALDASWPEEQILALEQLCQVRVESAPASLGRTETPCTHENMVRVRFHHRSTADDVSQSQVSGSSLTILLSPGGAMYR